MTQATERIPRGEVKFMTGGLKAALQVEESQRKNAVLEVVYASSPGARFPTPPRNWKRDVIDVLLIQIIPTSVDRKERRRAARVLIKIVGKTDDQEIVRFLLDPGPDRWANIQTGEARVEAALGILRNNPGILKKPLAITAILEAAEKTCWDQEFQSSIGDIADIAAMAKSASQRDHMIRHIKSGNAVARSAIALSEFNYPDIETAMPAIAALNELRAQEKGNPAGNAWHSVDKIVTSTTQRVAYSSSLELFEAMDSVLREPDSGLGQWGRKRVRSLVIDKGITDTLVLARTAAKFIGPKHPIRGPRAEAVLRATQAIALR